MAQDADKPLVWLSGEVKSLPFSTAARLEPGFLHRRLQRGEKLEPPHSKPMGGIGKRCHILFGVLVDFFAYRELHATAEAIRRDREGRQVKRKKRERLEKAGWTVGTPEEFLGLSAEEARYLELKLALSEAVRRQRSSAGLSQEELAKRLGSSQSRVSKMEKADPTVSIDLLVRSMLAAGATRRDIAAAITKARRRGS